MTKIPRSIIGTQGKQPFVSPAGRQTIVHRFSGGFCSFSWQEGYGAFTIGMSGVADTKNYIATQIDHHQKKTFQEEFRSFLDKHGLSYDAASLWD
jgi:hypothetical protein